MLHLESLVRRERGAQSQRGLLMRRWPDVPGTALVLVPGSRFLVVYNLIALAEKGIFAGTCGQCPGTLGHPGGSEMTSGFLLLSWVCMSFWRFQLGFTRILGA